MTTRRNFLASLAAVAALGPASQAIAQGGAIGEIRVDVSPLRNKGWGGTPLAVIDQTLRAGLRQAFADRMGRGGPLLVVRIDSVFLSTYFGGPDSTTGRFGGGSAPMSDYMDGELVLVGRGNSIISRTPLLSVYPSSLSGLWALPNNELRRMESLAAAYARWARWKLG